MRTTRQRNRRQDQGSLLLFSAFIISLLSAVLTAGLTRSTTDILAARQLVFMAQDYQGVESGLDCAISELRTSSNGNTIGATCSCNGLPACPVGQMRTVSVTQLQPLTANRYKIDTTWTSQGHSTVQQMIVQRTITSPFQQAALGVRTDNVVGVSVQYGSLVDSYKSTLGVYGKDLSASPDATYGNWNKSQDALPQTWNAEVRTSSVSPTQAIWVNYPYVGLPSAIKGSAYAPLGASSIFEESPTSITGVSGPGSAPTVPAIVQPPVPSCGTVACPYLPITNPVQSAQSYLGTCYCTYATGILVDSGGLLSLPNLQTLYVPGDIVVQGGGKFTVGKTTASTTLATIRSTGKLDVSNSGTRLEVLGGTADIYADRLTTSLSTLTGPNNIPSSLRFYLTGNTSSTVNVLVAFNSKVYGTIYAPNTPVEIMLGDSTTDTAVYGAVIGKYVSLSHVGRIHFDEALKTASTVWPSWMRAEVTVKAQGTNLTVCGDGMCNGSETQFTCPADCSIIGDIE